MSEETKAESTEPKLVRCMCAILTTNELRGTSSLGMMEGLFGSLEEAYGCAWLQAKKKNPGSVIENIMVREVTPEFQPDEEEKTEESS